MLEQTLVQKEAYIAQLLNANIGLYELHAQQQQLLSSTEERKASEDLARVCEENM